MKKDFKNKAVQLALRASAYDQEMPNKILDLSPFSGKRETFYRLPANTEDYSFFLLDITLCEDGHWRLIEANTSNAALSSISSNGDEARVKHLLELFLQKKSAYTKCVVLFAHQHRFIHLAEFFNRAARFAELLSVYRQVELRHVGESIGQEQVTVVAGEIAQIADYITLVDDQIHYKGIPIALASNPNLMPELERRKIINKQRDHDSIDDDIFHEQKCTRLGHDKAKQQDICYGTGIEPLSYASAESKSDCKGIINDFQRKQEVVVAKMNAGSGGTGIEFFTPWQSKEEIDAKLSEMEKSVCEKYGDSALTTMYPVRFFEFAKSKELVLNGKGHLWDMRLEVLVFPGFVEVRPCVVRACPEPFDGSYNRSSVVSNLSGRVDATMLGKFMFMSPYQAESSFHTGLKISQQKLDELIYAVVRWAENALISCSEECQTV